MRNRIKKVVQALEDTTFNKITAMSLYEISWNRRFHKGKRLNVACIQMTPDCKNGFENVLRSLIDDFLY